MRIGECPVRIKRGHVPPARVTVCILVSIPHQLDYYGQRLSILKLALRSLRAHTPREVYDLLVFDNGSCAEVVDFLVALRDRGEIDLLLLSTANRGKIDACRMMFAAAPGALVAYADDDVWFGPGWLEAQLAIYDTFPRVGTVSGRPVRQQFAYGTTFLARYLEEFPAIRTERGALIPAEWEREYMRSTGRRDSDAETVAAAHEDIRLEYNGVAAYATAAHFQFLAPKAIIQAALDNRTQPRTGSEERQFEEAIDAAGFARLSTVDRCVRHIGNVVSAELLADIGESDPSSDDTYRPPGPAAALIGKTRIVRSALSRLNRWTYQLLYQPPNERTQQRG